MHNNNYGLIVVGGREKDIPFQRVHAHHKSRKASLKNNFRMKALRPDKQTSCPLLVHRLKSFTHLTEEQEKGRGIIKNLFDTVPFRYTAEYSSQPSAIAILNHIAEAAKKSSIRKPNHQKSNKLNTLNSRFRQLSFKHQRRVGEKECMEDALIGWQ